MQDHYNLLYREEEREMLALCRERGVAAIPWSPLARGLLARPWSEKSVTLRAQTDPFSRKYYGATADADRRVVERVTKVAARRGVSQSQIALAWLMKNPVVAAPVIGATKLHHIDDAVQAVSLSLTNEEVRALEELYVPHPIVGFEARKNASSEAKKMFKYGAKSVRRQVA
jgi:aryl-alcohol dehydrogenase-like predicted oxidoreductase